MAGIKALRKIQLGREATAGTAVAATTIWRGEGAALKDNRTVEHVPELVGIATNTNRAYIGQEQAALTLVSTPATYEQLPHILEAGIMTATPAADGSASSGYLRTYTAPTTAARTLKTYTLETGDNQQAEETAYAFVTDFKLTGEKGKAVMMEANWLGRTVDKTTFTGALTIPVVEEILSQLGTVYIDAAGGTIGTTAITDTLLKWELSCTTGWRAKFTLDRGFKYFSFPYYSSDAWSAELSLTYEHNTTAVAQKDAFVAKTGRLVRLQVTGGAYGTAGSGTLFTAKKGLRIDCAGIYDSFEALDAEDGNSIVACKLKIGYDATWAKALELVVANELATLP
jgi:hypothetical protein